MQINLDYTPFKPQGIDGVDMDLKPLSFSSYQEIARLFGAMRAGEGDLFAVEKLGKEEIKTVAERVFPTHVGEVRGITIAEGGTTRPATVVDLTRHGAFLPLCLIILTELLTRASMSMTEGKLSAKPSAS